MSDICAHHAESTWTGPTPEDVFRARGRKHVLICFTDCDTGSEIYVRILSASMSIIWPLVTFTGRCTEGRFIEGGIACADASHLGRIHIEFTRHPHALSIVAATG